MVRDMLFITVSAWLPCDVVASTPRIVCRLHLRAAFTCFHRHGDPPTQSYSFLEELGRDTVH